MLQNRKKRADSKRETTEKITLYAPIKGTVIPREEIPDETFASGMLGEGYGIVPEAGEAFAPADGEITSVARTRHALGLAGPDGVEILIHVGIDTVKMDGDGFEMFVTEGERVKKGQKLMAFDLEKIKRAGFSPVTAVLVTNGDDYEIRIDKQAGEILASRRFA